mmetsp:Transcript_7759/g.20318  ORF Transcript_7759/g.20318 Transcript_7759/m.20318 type:complete len:275 (+) Transcript_7759:407-1231(+)
MANCRGAAEQQCRSMAGTYLGRKMSTVSLASRPRALMVGLKSSSDTTLKTSGSNLYFCESALYSSNTACSAPSLTTASMHKWLSCCRSAQSSTKCLLRANTPTSVECASGCSMILSTLGFFAASPLAASEAAGPALSSNVPTASAPPLRKATRRSRSIFPSYTSAAAASSEPAGKRRIFGRPSSPSAGSAKRARTSLVSSFLRISPSATAPATRAETALRTGAVVDLAVRTSACGSVGSSLKKAGRPAAVTRVAWLGMAAWAKLMISFAVRPPE